MAEEHDGLRQPIRRDKVITLRMLRSSKVNGVSVSITGMLSILQVFKRGRVVPSGI